MKKKHWILLNNLNQMNMKIKISKVIELIKTAIPEEEEITDFRGGWKNLTGKTFTLNDIADAIEFGEKKQRQRELEIYLRLIKKIEETAQKEATKTN